MTNPLEKVEAAIVRRNTAMQRVEAEMARRQSSGAATAPAAAPTAPPQPGTLANPGEARPVSGLEFARAGVREHVEGLPGLPQFIAEAGPATAGAFKGATVGGAMAGPPGAVLGGAVGGLGGEALAQAAGVTPESRLARELAGGSAFIGPAVGAGLRLGRRAFGGAVTGLPPAASALGQLARKEGLTELESLGSKILQSQRGLMARPAGQLYDAARRSGIVVQGDQLRNTQRALGELDAELRAFADFPEAQQALNIVDRTMGALGQDAVSFDTIVTAKKLIGSAVAAAKRGTGTSFGSTKKVFGAFAQDIDNLAGSAGAARRPARIAQAAAKRAKLEFSIDELDGAVANFARDVPGTGGVEINVVGLQKWLRDTTNPRSAKFNKNFTDALADDLPKLRSRLADLVAISDSGKLGGPGALMIQGIAAGAGGTIGYAVLGGPGAVVGGALGVRVPKALTGALLHPRAAAMLQSAAKLGKGEIPIARWTAIASVVTKAAGVEDDAPPVVRLSGAASAR